MRYFIVAELGINHLGDMALAKEMIAQAEQAGADAVKTQHYVWDDIAQDYSDPEIAKQVKAFQLTLEEQGELRDYAHSRGLGFVCTPFKRTVRIAEVADLKPDAIKIRYRDFDLRFLEAALRQNVPFVMASCPAPPIDRMDVYYHQRARWLYCIPEYPPEPEQFQAAISSGFHGFSDHYPHITASLVAAALTRSNEYIIEKHVMLDQQSPDYPDIIAPGKFAKLGTPPDLPVSISFKQLGELVKHLRLMEKLRPGELYFPHPPRPSR